jgi:hypothetical protein
MSALLIVGAAIAVLVLGFAFYQTSIQPYEVHDLRGVCVMEIHPTDLNGFTTKPCGSTRQNEIAFSTPLFPGAIEE